MWGAWVRMGQTPVEDLMGFDGQSELMFYNLIADAWKGIIKKWGLKKGFAWLSHGQPARWVGRHRSGLAEPGCCCLVGGDICSRYSSASWIAWKLQHGR